MKLSSICENYFNGFHEICNYKKNDKKTIIFACLKIISYFTVIIPWGFITVYGIHSLCGRIHKKHKLTNQDQLINNQYKKIIEKDKEPIAKNDLNQVQDPEVKLPNEIDQNLLLQERAKEAAKGNDKWAPGMPTSYSEIEYMVSRAAVEEIPYIIRGATRYIGGLFHALLQLLEDSESLHDRELNFEKLKLAIREIKEDVLIDVICLKQEWILDLLRNGKWRFSQPIEDNQKLSILLKHKDELLLSETVINKLNEVLEQTANYDEASKNLPKFYYE